MTLTSSKSDSSRNAITVGLLGIFLIGISVAYFLHRYPLRIAAQPDREKAAVYFAEDSFTGKDAQVMLLVDTSIIRESWSHQSLAQADFSYGWASTLQQEFGYFNVRDVGGVDSSELSDSRIVVFSSSALRGMSGASGDYALLNSFIGGGGFALLDYPDDEALAALQLRRSTLGDKRQKLSAQELLSLLGDERDNPSSNAIPDSLPVFSTIQSYTFSDPQSSNAIQRTESFEFISRGSGGALLTKWNFGRWVTLTQQGLPDKNLRAENRYSQFGHSDKLEANDLVADSSYLNATYPWVDIIEKQLVNFISNIELAPRWFTAPKLSSGIFMMTHDDEGLGDAGAWMNKYESQRGYRSTSFLLFSNKLSPAGVQLAIANGGDIGLHWNRFEREDKAALETIGVGRWRPALRRRNLQSQSAWLESLGGKSRYNRNHYFLWDNDPYQPFRALSAAGVTMDYSYGPDLNDKGYLFGNAFPFYPLDDNGASFELTETPVTWTENFGGADSVWIEQILSENASRFHGVVVALYHNNTFAWAPDYAIYTSWRESYELARSSGHALLTASELESFLEARTKSEINWQTDSESVEVYCNVTKSGLALIVPLATLAEPTIATHGEEVATSADSETAEEVRIDSVSIIGVPYWRIALPQGKFLLSFERLANSKGGSR